MANSQISLLFKTQFVLHASKLPTKEFSSGILIADLDLVLQSFKLCYLQCEIRKANAVVYIQSRSA